MKRGEKRGEKESEGGGGGEEIVGGNDRIKCNII